MTDWLRLPSGQAVNMDRVTTITRLPHSAPGTAEHVSLRTTDGQIIDLIGPEAAAVDDYLRGRPERVHVSEHA